MKRMFRRLDLQGIRLDFQPPENLCDEVVDDYVHKFHRREKVDPVVVYYDGTHYYLFDGFHRVAAATKVGRKRLRAEVVLGTLADMEAEWQRYLAELKKSLRDGAVPTSVPALHQT
jgi:hypothetical protein